MPLIPEPVNSAIGGCSEPVASKNGSSGSIQKFTPEQKQIVDSAMLCVESLALYAQGSSKTAKRHLSAKLKQIKQPRAFYDQDDKKRWHSEMEKHQQARKMFKKLTDMQIDSEDEELEKFIEKWEAEPAPTDLDPKTRSIYDMLADSRKQFAYMLRFCEETIKTAAYCEYANAWQIMSGVRTDETLLSGTTSRKNGQIPFVWLDGNSLSAKQDTLHDLIASVIVTKLHRCSLLNVSVGSALQEIIVLSRDAIQSAMTDFCKRNIKTSNARNLWSALGWRKRLADDICRSVFAVVPIFRSGVPPSEDILNETSSEVQEILESVHIDCLKLAASKFFMSSSSDMRLTFFVCFAANQMAGSCGDPAEVQNVYIAELLFDGLRGILSDLVQIPANAEEAMKMMDKGISVPLSNDFFKKAAEHIIKTLEADKQTNTLFIHSIYEHASSVLDRMRKHAGSTKSLECSDLRRETVK